jgi:hypothetical protein
MSYYIHSVPGRLRIKLPQLKSNLPHCQEVQALLLGLEGVQDVEANCLTGSMLVRYDPKFITFDCIMMALEEEEHIHSRQAIDSDQYIRKAVNTAGQTVGKAVFSWAVSKALERSSFGLLAALI